MVTSSIECKLYVCFFQPDYMYTWSHTEPIFQQLEEPGKLQLESWPPLQALLEAERQGKKDTGVWLNVLSDTPISNTHIQHIVQVILTAGF